MNDIDHAIKLLKQGEVIGLPTETVYGLAGAINQDKALSRIFAVKERPFFDPLIVHVNSLSMAKEYALSWHPALEALTKKFWPGPLTIIVPKKNNVSDLITSGLTKVGLRSPNHPVALEIITKLGIPLAAPSANKFKKTSPTTAQHVRAEFNDEIFTVDGGACEVGIESTIIEVIDDMVKIYRPGIINKEDIKKTLEQNGLSLPVVYAKSEVAPGQLEHHYMPSAPLVLISSKYQNDYQKIIMDKIDLSNVAVWNVTENAAMVARLMYARFRELSQNNPSAIIMILPQNEIQSEAYVAIMNRLNKAKTFAFLD